MKAKDHMSESYRLGGPLPEVLGHDVTGPHMVEVSGAWPDMEFPYMDAISNQVNEIYAKVFKSGMKMALGRELTSEDYKHITVGIRDGQFMTEYISYKEQLVGIINYEFEVSHRPSDRAIQRISFTPRKYYEAEETEQ